MPEKSEKELSDRIAREFAAELRRRLGDRIQKIILYGSRARGDFREGSDFDLIVLTEKPSREVESLVLDLEGEFMDRYNVLICSFVRGTREWREWRRYPFVELVEAEGIIL